MWKEMWFSGLFLFTSSTFAPMWNDTKRVVFWQDWFRSPWQGTSASDSKSALRAAGKVVSPALDRVTGMWVLSHFSRVWRSAILWAVAHQAALTMGFSNQEYWSGSPCPPPWDLPDPGIEPISLTSPALAGRFFTLGATNVIRHNLRSCCYLEVQQGRQTINEFIIMWWMLDTGCFGSTYQKRIAASELWCWRRLLRVPWTARRSNQSILKVISPEYSLEGLMLKLKLLYFGHLMLRTDSLEKTLMTWKQPRCPSADEWIRKLWYVYTMEYYSAITKNAFESVLMRWMKLEPIIQSEVSQKEKHQYSILTHIYVI